VILFVPFDNEENISFGGYQFLCTVSSSKRTPSTQNPVKAISDKKDIHFQGYLLAADGDGTIPLPARYCAPRRAH
jgi:hypothetical protein